MLVTGDGLPPSQLQSTPLKSPMKKRKLTTSETEEKRGETSLTPVPEESEEMELEKSLQLSKKFEKDEEEEEECDTASEVESDFYISDYEGDEVIEDVLERSGKTREAFAKYCLDKSFGKGFSAFDRTPTKKKIPEPPKFYVPGNMKMMMKVPKFLLSTAENNCEFQDEISVGSVMAMADEMKANLEAIWDHPNFDNFYYCTFTHDDNYPAWYDQKEYHFKKS